MNNGVTSETNGQNGTAAVALTWSALFTTERAPISIMLSGGVAVHALSVHVVATILPSAVYEIGGMEYYAWTTTLALIGAILSSVCATALSGGIGPRRAYWMALATFAAGSAMCGVAPTMGILLAGRASQGIGGGLLTALAYAIIRQTLPPELRTRAIAMLSGLWGIAALSGPLLGGLLAGAGAWRWAFWIDIPFAAMIAVLVRRVLPERTAASDHVAMPRSSVLGQLVLLGLSALPIAWGGASSTSGYAAAGTMIGLGIFWLMLYREQRAVRLGTPHLLPAGAFDPRSDLGAVTLTMALMGASLSAVLFLPLVASRAYGFPPIARGYFGGVMAISWTLAALATASFVEPRSRRAIVMTGPFLMLAGLATEAIAISNGSLWLMVFAMVPLGLGIGGAWAHLGALLMETALPAERDLASACITTTQLIAGALGSAVAGTIANLAGLAAAVTVEDRIGIVRAAIWLFVIFSVFPVMGVATARRAVKHAWRDD
jgi:MFS family permease